MSNKPNTLKRVTFILSILNRNWFTSLWPTTNPFAVSLLLSVYAHAHAGRPLCKKEAWMHIGVADIKTARKYILSAIQNKQVMVIADRQDRRKTLLLPSPELVQAIEEEVEKILQEMRCLFS